MKDLSKLDIPKKQKNEIQQSPEKPKLNKKKKILIIVVIILLGVAVTSKMINKHLKKIKAEEKAKIEQQIDKKETKSSTKNTANEQKTNNEPEVSENTPSGKMIFTFYDNLKHDSVSVNVKPESKRAQYKYTYIYQVASFRNLDETLWYVKKMKEDGLNPKFQRVGNWIRMYIGPYDSQRAMAPDIIKLQRLGLNGGFPREISRTKIEPKDDKKETKTEASTTDEKNNPDKKTPVTKN